jgi:hypothetical protein
VPSSASGTKTLSGNGAALEVGGRGRPNGSGGRRSGWLARRNENVSADHLIFAVSYVNSDPRTGLKWPIETFNNQSDLRTLIVNRIEVFIV